MKYPVPNSSSPSEITIQQISSIYSPHPVARSGPISNEFLHLLYDAELNLLGSTGTGLGAVLLATIALSMIFFAPEAFSVVAGALAASIGK
ncbi:MAG: hypothetical protein AAF092_14970 [Pseudomonadota bacterium]